MLCEVEGVGWGSAGHQGLRVSGRVGISELTVEHIACGREGSVGSATAWQVHRTRGIRNLPCQNAPAPSFSDLGAVRRGVLHGPITYGWPHFLLPLPGFMVSLLWFPFGTQNPLPWGLGQIGGGSWKGTTAGKQLSESSRFFEAGCGWERSQYRANETSRHGLNKTLAQVMP